MRHPTTPEDVAQHGQHAEGASQAQSQHRVLGGQQVIVQPGHAQHHLRSHSITRDTQHYARSASKQLPQQRCALLSGSIPLMLPSAALRSQHMTLHQIVTVEHVLLALADSRRTKAELSCRGQSTRGGGHACLAPSAALAMTALVLQAALSCHCDETMERSVLTARSPRTRYEMAAGAQSSVR